MKEILYGVCIASLLGLIFVLGANFAANFADADSSPTYTASIVPLSTLVDTGTALPIECIVVEYDGDFAFNTGCFQTPPPFEEAP